MGRHIIVSFQCMGKIRSSVGHQFIEKGTEVVTDRRVRILIQGKRGRSMFDKQE